MLNARQQRFAHQNASTNRNTSLNTHVLLAPVSASEKYKNNLNYIYMMPDLPISKSEREGSIILWFVYLYNTLESDL